MTRMTASKVRSEFSETMNRVAFGGERVVIERSGKDVVAMVPVSDLALIQAIEDRIDIAQAAAVLRESEADGFEDWESVKRALGI